MSKDAEFTELKAYNLFRSIQEPSQDQNRQAVKAILDKAETAEEAAELLTMLDLYGVAEDMLTERENELADDGLGGDAA